MNYLKWKEPYLNLIFAYEKGKEVTLLYAGMNDREPDTDYKGCRIVDVLTPDSCPLVTSPMKSSTGTGEKKYGLYKSIRI